MKRLMTFAALCAVLTVSALAQDAGPNAPATRQDIERYLDAVHSHQMMTQMMDAMAKPMHKMVHDQYL